MITHKTGDIFTTELNAIGHGVNIEGAMGSGIAVAVRNNYPDVYSTYRKVCLSEKGLSGGDLLVVQAMSDQKFIFNLASQEKQGRNATYEFLTESLVKSLEFCSDNGIEGLALPQIGCGIGGLEWDSVLSIIEEESEKHPEILLELWTYPDLPKHYWKK